MDIHQQEGGRRASAKQEIHNVWKERRRSQHRHEKRSSTSTAISPSASLDTVSQNHQNQKTHSEVSSKNKTSRCNECALPAFCSLVWRAWDHHKKNSHTANNQNTERKRRSLKQIGSNNSYTVFPSVINILQANALMDHVERTFQTQQGHEEMSLATTKESNSLSHNEGSQKAGLPLGGASSSSWNVLSSQYDFHTALVEMSRSRSRAFYMVDVATVVKRLVLLKEMYPEITLTHPSLQEPLIRDVMIQHNICLVTDTAQDLINLSQQQQFSDPYPNPDFTARAAQGLVLYDNTIYPGKPDSYLRCFLSSQLTEKVITIDGSDEVKRTLQTIKRLRLRRKLLFDLTDVGFVLRLPESDIETWPSLLHDAFTTIEECCCSEPATMNSNIPIKCRLIGISFDVASACSEDYSKNESCKLEQQEMAKQLIDHIVLLQQKHQEIKLRIDLTGFGSIPLDVSWATWWNELLQTHEHSNLHITVDCSNLLLPQAGALCTRIIGVRENLVSSVENMCGEPSSEPNRHRHYYIDDGCYGSLYQQPTKVDGSGSENTFQPLPLFSPRQSQKQLVSPGSDTNNDFQMTESTETSVKDDEDNDSITMTLSTVWGPTCDGLDRVCRDIILPKLHRDDWLVFFPSQEAAGGLDDNNKYRTAFNGFEPPDTAFCVLGYFPKDPSESER